VPVETEARTVPFDYGPGPDNRKRIKNAREEAIETNEHQSVDGTEGLFLGGGSSQNNYLLPQRQDLCLDRCSRTTAQTMSLKRSLITDQHRPILGQPPAIRFATGTGGAARRPQPIKP
jgi:hypothetical protein